MRKIVLLLLFFVSVSSAAQDFKILFVNTETIRIGGKDLKKGDVFFESDKISWKGDKQAMKVLSLSDNKQYVLVSNEFKQKKVNSAKDYLVRSNRLSTRGAGSLSGVARQLGSTIYVVDTTRVPVAYVPQEAEYFFLILSSGRRFNIGYDDGHLVFSPEIWQGESVSSGELFFHYSDGIEECVIDNLSIISLPETIQIKRHHRR